MSITLNLKPELEERLRWEARQQGKLLEDYLLDLVALPGVTLPQISSIRGHNELLQSQGSDVKEGLKEGRHTRSLLDLSGVGAHLWANLEPQEYVNELRREWDHRP